MFFRRKSNVLKLHSNFVDIWNHYLTDIHSRPSTFCAVTRSHVRSRLQTMPKRRHDDNSIVKKSELKKHSEMGAVLSLCSCFKSSDQAEKSTSDVTENTGLLSERLVRSYDERRTQDERTQDERRTQDQGSACATDLQVKVESDQHVDITYGVTTDIKEINCSLNDQNGAIKKDEFQNVEENNWERDAEVHDYAAYLKTNVTADEVWNDVHSHKEAVFDGQAELVSAQDDNSQKTELLSAQGAPSGQTELVSAQGDKSERKELVFARGDSSGQTERVSVQGYNSEQTEFVLALDDTSGDTISDCTRDDLTRQTESISSQIDAGTKKRTVLPKQLLDSITRNVSERCSSDDSWLQTIGLEGDDLSDTEVFGGQMITDAHGEDGKTASKKKGGKKNVNEEKVAKPRPNYFIAIQVKNPKIHIGLGEVQEAVLNVEPRMKEVMIPLPTLHLTLYVTHLPDDESIDRATAALEEAGEELRPSFQTGCPVCRVSGLGTFRNQVVFAKISPGEALDQLAHIHDVVNKKMAEHGLESIDNSPLIPHITLMKMSKVRGRFRKSVAKKIDPDLYKKFKDTTFGEEVINTLQLCSMMKQKDVFGYYQVLHKVDLSSEGTTVNKFCEGLVQSALVSAMETVRKDLQNDSSTDKQKQKSTKARKRKPRKKTTQSGDN